MDKNSKIYVAGHQGMVGSAILHHLQKHSFANIVTRTSAELDLRNQLDVNQFFSEETPNYFFGCSQSWRHCC